MIGNENINYNITKINKDEYGINPDTSDENMILGELKEEDIKLEREKSNIKAFEESFYDIKFKTMLESPILINSYEEKNECFTVRFDKFDNQIAAGK